MRTFIIWINVITMCLGFWFAAVEPSPGFWGLTAIVGSITIPAANIFFNLNYKDTKSEGILSLFLTRKRLEEQAKIDKLKSDVE